MSTFYGQTVADTYKTIVHFDTPLVYADGGRQVLQDGNGINSSISIGASGAGLTVTGIISTDSGLKVGGDLTIVGNIIFPTQTNINDVTINYVGSPYSIEATYEAAFGSVRMENADTNYQLVFGDRDAAYKWKIDVNTADDSLNFRRNDAESIPPMFIDTVDGSVNISKLVLTVPPTITTVPTPSADGDFLVLGNFTGSNTSLSTVSATGFQKLPSGLILQWGTAAVTTNAAGTTINFGFTFPNNAINVTATPTDDFSVGSNYMGGTYAKVNSNSNFKCLIKGTTGTALQGIVNWQAIGW